MRAPITRTWKDRLPGVAFALALQAAIFAAIVYSLVPAILPRAAEEAREIVFLLPRLRPVPPREPVIIDGRPTPAPEAPSTAVAPSWSPPLWATPQFDLPGAPPKPGSDRALMMALGRALDCVPDEKGRLSRLCARAPPLPADALARPSIPNENMWASEKARADAPFTLPGGTPLGILMTAITNPSAFLDKRAYSNVSPPPRTIDGVEIKEWRLRQRQRCPPGGLTDFERYNCNDRAAGLGVKD